MIAGSKNMKYFIIIVCLLAASVQSLWAEPNETSTFLINDPISLLDFGMYKLENDIKSYRDDLPIKHQPPYSVFVDYDWDENKIFIVLSYGTPGNPLIKEIKNEIKKVLIILKRNFGVGPKGEPFQKGGFSSISDYFSHRGYTKKNIPQTFKKDIDQLMVFKVVYYVQNYSRYFECRNMLVGNSIDDIQCTDYLP
jgi:hypothetical protein